MKNITTVWLDLTKSVFQVHGILEEEDVIAHCSLASWAEVADSAVAGDVENISLSLARDACPELAA